MSRRHLNVSHLLSAMMIFVPLSTSSGAIASEQDIRVLLDRHCAACHGDETSEGKLNLSRTDWKLGDAGVRKRWVQIHDRIQQGEMPPRADELPERDRVLLVRFLRIALHEADLKDVQESGRGPMRRLNRDEYEQNLRDVLQLPNLDVRDMLPEDREQHHFNKSAEVLDMSRVQLAAYLDAADVALRQAVASGSSPPSSSTYRALATRMFQEAQTFGNREAMFYAKDSKGIPLDGKQLREIRASGKHDPGVEMALFRSASWPYYGYPEGFVAQSTGEYRVRFSARAVHQMKGFELKVASQPQPMTFRARSPSGPDVSGDVRATGGTIDIQPEVAEYETVIRLRKGETFEYSLLGLPVPLARNVNNGPPTYRYPPFPEGGQPGIAFQWIEVTGPLAPSTWPPPSHHVLFDDLPITPSQTGNGLPTDVIAQEPDAEVGRLLRHFIKVASRQPVPEGVVLKYEQLIRTRLKQGATFSEAMLAGYKAFLCSTHFLYLQEPGSVANHFAIASRLSHFLTNSRPDAQLVEHAENQQLLDSRKLRDETDRLIARPGFGRFVRNFTDYWLNLRHVRRDDPDTRLYPEYRFDDYLIESMEQESRAYFSAMVRENLPVSVVIDSEFIFSNDRLARHYGFSPLMGSAMRKVPVPKGSPYGGLLTHAAILKVTSNGTTTSPVVRGAWIMDRLVGSPPPPPPASVPAVEPDIRGGRTIRKLLALHTRSAECANCHARFDPVGLALENFDVLGAWRTQYRGLEHGQRVTGIDRAGHDFAYAVGETIDASGTLQDGQPFANIHDLKQVLAEDPRQLARNLLGQLTVYSTGIPVRFSDRAEIEVILDACADNQYRVRDLLHSLIQSRIFLGQACCVEGTVP
ncbi:MAG: DUF1592 domain-containing protein [Planctomycetota bacterium]|nr:DUF1592 domain-containing protein [Planctomycetota bacterium]